MFLPKNTPHVNDALLQAREALDINNTPGYNSNAGAAEPLHPAVIAFIVILVFALVVVPIVYCCYKSSDRRRGRRDQRRVEDEQARNFYRNNRNNGGDGRNKRNTFSRYSNDPYGNLDPRGIPMPNPMFKKPPRAHVRHDPYLRSDEYDIELPGRPAYHQGVKYDARGRRMR